MTDNGTTINLPPRLAKEAEEYIQSGWAPDLNTLIIEALRRYLDAHQIDLQDRFVTEDIEWGLHGND